MYKRCKKGKHLWGIFCSLFWKQWFSEFTTRNFMIFIKNQGFFNGFYNKIDEKWYLSNFVRGFEIKAYYSTLEAILIPRIWIYRWNKTSFLEVGNTYQRIKTSNLRAYENRFLKKKWGPLCEGQISSVIVKKNSKLSLKNPFLLRWTRRRL